MRREPNEPSTSAAKTVLRANALSSAASRQADPQTRTLTAAEFEVLDRAAEPLAESERAARADPWGPSVQAIERAESALRARGLVSADGSISEAGLRALEPYRVRNAVILAAGASTRFAPVSFQKPKGLLEARGEVLIERQIRQLHAAGIADIAVVVGYHAADFAYLADRFGVALVDSPAYALRNNHDSLNCASALISSTYICVSDGYYERNPFTRYRFRAEYAVEARREESPQWVAATDRSGRITGIAVRPPDDETVLCGPAYFDPAFSQRFLPIIATEASRPESAGKLWEAVLEEHLRALPMAAAVYERGTLFEFNTLNDLCAFDPLFIENVNSEALDNIVRTVGCDRGNIGDFYPLKEGLTNLSCHFAVTGAGRADGEYVYRAPGAGTEELIDRASECAAQKLARTLGLDETFLYEDAQTGWKISRFIPDCTPLDPEDDEQLACAMRFARALHEADAHLARSFDFYDEGERYCALMSGRDLSAIPGFDELRDKARRVRAGAAADHAPICVTHNDFFNLNFLREHDGTLHLIDWEYAGMGDYANDFGTFTVCCQLSRERAEKALSLYFDRTPTFSELRHNFAFVGLAGWCWYLWSLYKNDQGDNVGAWLYIYHAYARRYLDLVCDWYERGDA